MFCPKCSQAQPADDLRFCPRCGFPLVPVKELLDREGKHGNDGTGAGEGWRLPAQKDLATGALLMFAGSVVALLWGFMGSRGPAEALLPQAYFIMGGTLAFLLTLFHPLLRSLQKLFSGGGTSPDTSGGRDGINLGALLMFVGALKATLLTSGMHPGPERGLTALAFTAGMLMLILLLRPVLRTAHGLLFKGDKSADSPAAEATLRLDSQERGRALPPLRAYPSTTSGPRPRHRRTCRAAERRRRDDAEAGALKRNREWSRVVLSPPPLLQWRACLTAENHNGNCPTHPAENPLVAEVGERKIRGVRR